MKDETADILAIEEERCRAERAGDMATLERLLDDSLVYIHTNGLIDSKKSLIASRDKMKFQKMDRRDLKVRVSGDLAVITGGSVGIGLAVAEAFAAEGANVLITARNEARVVGEARRIEDKYAVRSLGVAADVATSAGCDAVIAKLGGDLDSVMAWSFDNRRPADYGALIPLLFDYYETGDPVAQRLIALELSEVDKYVAWFKARGYTRLAPVGGFGTRLYPELTARYGALMVMPQHEPLHGAVILAKQNFGSQPL